jgi:hypothetical protein
MCQAVFLSDRKLWELEGIDLSSLAVMMPQLVEPSKSG